ncbi:uncharacterized protein LOC134786144 [Penaeus indicus]|uniref:uncharacterized protein LOC134786144 n=1 Tax=Penaeus indicus TaxID=29960 RepID=UPI00300C0A5A
MITESGDFHTEIAGSYHFLSIILIYKVESQYIKQKLKKMNFLSEWMPLAPPSDDEIYNQGILIKEMVKEEIKKENDLEIQEENDLEIKEEKDLEIKEESLDYEVSDTNLKHKYPSSMGSKSIREEENGRNSYKIMENCNGALVTTPLVADHYDTIQMSGRHKEGREEATYQKPCSQRVKIVEHNEVDTNKCHTCEICCKIPFT